MGTRISHEKNVKLLNKRISVGDPDQYFSSVSPEDIRVLSEALNEDNFEAIQNILINNLTSYGSEFSDVINSSYDAQVEDMALRMIRKYVSELIIRTRRAIESQDVSELSELRDEIDFDFPEGFRRDTSNILKQINLSIQKISVPEKMVEEILALIKEKKKKIKDVTKSGVYEKFGRWKKPALVLFSKKGFLSWKPITKEQFNELRTTKKEIPKFKKVDQIKAKTITEFRKDMRGKPLNFKEKAFIDSRLDQEFETIYEEFLDKFGKVRTKTELKKLVKKR